MGQADGKRFPIAAVALALALSSCRVDEPLLPTATTGSDSASSPGSTPGANPSSRKQHRRSTNNRSHYCGSPFGKHGLRYAAHPHGAELRAVGRRCAHLPFPGLDGIELHQLDRAVASNLRGNGRIDGLEGGASPLRRPLLLEGPGALGNRRERLFRDRGLHRQRDGRRLDSAAHDSAPFVGNHTLRSARRRKPRRGERRSVHFRGLAGHERFGLHPLRGADALERLGRVRDDRPEAVEPLGRSVHVVRHVGSLRRGLSAEPLSGDIFKSSIPPAQPAVPPRALDRGRRAARRRLGLLRLGGRPPLPVAHRMGTCRVERTRRRCSWTAGS